MALSISMYTNFFALSEAPFSIAPNPKYFFMSVRHREALEHLTYGLDGNHSGGAYAESNGGFVLLTGEVGTGKTTLSRCLMEKLPKHTQVAFILNPTLSSQELLATICDQLKIRYRKTGATLKTLTDKISEKLLKNYAKDKNTLLIIDEAQHLQPEVLEQLRLLTNLETNTKKLLQVILIGQPELQQLLQRRDLRQLAQRITARYHLLPLNKQEVALYIKHRLSVADCHRVIFNAGAITKIHNLSQGIPRLINLICHRGLMNAYNNNDTVVNKKTIVNAAVQALGDEYLPTVWWQQKRVKTLFFSIILIFALSIGYFLGQDKPIENIKPSIIQKPLENEKSTNKEKSFQKLIPSNSVEPQLVISVDKPSVVSEKSSVGTLSSSVSVLETKVKKSAELDEHIAAGEEETQAIEYKVEAVEGVSDALLARFQDAIIETESSSENEKKSKKTRRVKSLTQMPQWVQDGVPKLEFEQHIYTSDGQGWVHVNGRDRYEGDKIADDVFLDEILPQQVILIYRGETFSLPALTNW